MDSAINGAALEDERSKLENAMVRPVDGLAPASTDSIVPEIHVLRHVH